MNVFDYLTANIEVTGTIPNIPDRAKVTSKLLFFFIKLYYI